MENKPTETDNESEDGEMDMELHALFLAELADVLSAETQLTKALPKMAQAAQGEELKEAFTSHLKETQGHIERLNQVFKTLDETPARKICKAMKGLVEEGAEIMDEQKESTALDAGLIAAAQKVEHYEIASYGTLVTWATEMGHEDAVELLQQTLDEEKAADEKLTKIAQEEAN